MLAGTWRGVYIRNNFFAFPDNSLRSIRFCVKKETTEGKKSPDVCDDYADVKESELEKRKQFAYTRQAPDLEKQCKTCKLYLPPKTGEKCGGCTLFKGPVDAIGSCTYWAPLDI